MEIILKDGTKVKEGDCITTSIKFPYGYSTHTFNATIEDLRNLVKRGFAKEVVDPIPLGDLYYYTNKLLDKYGEVFTKLPVSIRFSMILKEIAIDLDKAYADHIKYSKYLYIISNLDGKVHQVNPKFLDNFLHFAAFRSKEDAETACKIVSPYISNMFNESQN
jgi:hypothetical protein